MTKRLTIDEFISRSNKLHNNKYDYSKVEYTGLHKKVIIVCPIHGDFSQSADSHMRSGSGCSKCSGNAKSSTSEFILKSQKKHGEKYSYASLNYHSMDIAVIITCPVHGDFSQDPRSHLGGHGCSKCSGNIRKTTDEFINSAKVIHNDKYDYSTTEYKSAHTNVSIRCKTHGIFLQNAGHHLNGHGCTKCTIGISTKEKLWLDSLGIPEEFRQCSLVINNRRIIADAFDPVNNIVYEFLGDFWHGNPRIFKPMDINPVKGETFGKLYNDTLIKKNVILAGGYKLIEKWETE